MLESNRKVSLEDLYGSFEQSQLADMESLPARLGQTLRALS